MSEELTEDFFSQSTRPGRGATTRSKLSAPKWNDPEEKPQEIKASLPIKEVIANPIIAPVKTEREQVLNSVKSISINNNQVNDIKGLSRASVVNSTNVQRVRKYDQYTPRSLRVTSSQYNFLNTLCDDIHYTRRNSVESREDNLQERITYNSILRATIDIMKEKFELKKDSLNYNVESEEDLKTLVSNLLN